MSKYDDIINLPYPYASKHERMSLYNRSAQFAPFAALSGHSEAILETARQTHQRIEIDDYIKGNISYKLNLIQTHIKDNIEIEITYFKDDLYKAGGEYITYQGYIKKIDEYCHTIKLDNQEFVDINDIIMLESEQLHYYEVEQ